MTVTVPPSDLAPRLKGLSLDQISIPNGREEEWRFTPLKRIGKLHELNGVEDSPVFKISAPKEVQIATAKIVDFSAADRISAAAALLSAEGKSITIPKEVILDEPVVIETSSSAAKSVGSLSLKIEKYAKGTFIIDHTGSGAMALAVEIDIAEGADATVISIHDGDRQSVFTGQQAIRLGRDAKVHHVAITLGGDLVRLVTTVEYTAPGGDAVLSGAYFTDAGQHHEHRLFVDHSINNCRSDVMYKGALQGQDAHSVWIGDVLIRGKATGTSTYELNRNLILTEGARADSVPNLEIETGEIEGAGHASATGRFDDEQIFYLMSRGVPEVQAKRLVVRGFLADVIVRIPSENLQQRLIKSVENKLGQVDPLFAQVFDEQ
jgi:Fe-S cluster assembly protein SufD